MYRSPTSTTMLLFALIGCISIGYYHSITVNAFVPTTRLRTFANGNQFTPSPTLMLHALTPKNNNKNEPQDDHRHKYLSGEKTNQDLFSKPPSTAADDTIMESSLPLATSATVKQDEGDDDGTAVWKARSLLIGAAALYGTNFSLVKLLGDTMPEGVSLTLRFALASAVTLPWLFDEGGTAAQQLPNADVLMATWLGFEVGLWNSIGYVAQAVGLETTPASKSAFICSLAVVVVPLLDFFTGKRIETRQWVGAFLAVVGVAFLELGGVGGGGDALMLSKGDLLSLVQPFAFGIGFWKIEKALQRYPSQARRLTAAQLLAVFTASACYGLSAIDPSALQSYPWGEWLTDPSILFSLFWTGCITTALTIYMENKAMETLSAAEATVIFATEPLWGTAFATVVMSEQLGVNSAIGAAFIMSACFYSNLGMGGLTGIARGINEKASEVPGKVQHQWVSFVGSVAASWASWDVAMASAAESLPDMDGIDDTLNGIVTDILDNLPW
mmetsp:Transcript_17272/g.20579  ORF Transcript_17272/g.20579 Transcript_17272/m.20579 type:complete len:500 (-) Transcript_17272:263-1762(-)